MLCIDCERELERDQARYAFGEYYCESCFNDLFTYCNHCDEIIYRTEAHWDDDGDALCNACYDNQYDEDGPQNPDVYEDDRKLIISLSRNWVVGDLACNSLISVNNADYELKNIRNQVGLVNNPVYVYGLRDRDEYNLTATSDIIDELTVFLNSRGHYLYIEKISGRRKIGLSLSFRQNYSHLIVELLQHIARESKGVACVA